MIFKSVSLLSELLPLREAALKMHAVLPPTMHGLNSEIKPLAWLIYVMNMQLGYITVSHNLLRQRDC